MEPKSKQTTETPSADYADLQKQIDELRGERAELLGLVKALTDEDTDVEREVETLIDPYAEDAPFSITGKIPPDETHPEGQVLRWLNAEARDRQGRWRGWEVMKWGDQYTGKPEDKKLREYGVTDPPAIMASGEKFDNSVKRGDLVLGRLDGRVYRARCAQSVRRANESRAAANRFTTTIPKEGAVPFGSGLQDDPRSNAIGIPQSKGSIKRSTLAEISQRMKEKERNNG